MASMAAVLVSSALIVSPAAAVETSTSEAVVLPPTHELQVDPTYKSDGELTTLGMGNGAKAFWCWFGIC
jgi:hypothetical protein